LEYVDSIKEHHDYDGATINALAFACIEATQELKVFLSDLFTSYTTVTGIMVISVHWVSIDKTALQRGLRFVVAPAGPP
jgi:hypothetical protein